MNTMKAALIHNFEGIEKISIETISVPIPKDHEVQIQIKFASINPVDWKIAEGLLKTRMEYHLPIILGWDAAGMVSQIGSSVTELKIGDPVFAYCRKECMQDGSFADYICLPAENVVKKPDNLSFAEAAAVPLVTLTAWQSLFESADLKTQETVLIHAGAGGVGSMAIQLAKLAGAYVITTTSAANADYVKELGADLIIDYTKESFSNVLLAECPHGVDVLFDTVGGETLLKSYGVVKKKGHLVTIAGVLDQALASKQEIKAEFVFVRPNGKQLNEIAALLKQKKLVPPRLQEIPFKEIAQGLRKSREGHTQGKIVVNLCK